MSKKHISEIPFLVEDFKSCKKKKEKKKKMTKKEQK